MLRYDDKQVAWVLLAWPAGGLTFFVRNR